MNSCLSQELIVYIKSMLGTPELERLDSALSNLTCTDSTSGGVPGRTDDPTGSHPSTHRTAGSSNRLTIDILALGLSIYAYVTPFIIAIGIVGNLISLRVFMSRRMRKMSASLYLACLAVSDSCVLLTYVLFEWLQRGLPSWPGGHVYNLSSAFPGMCQLYAFSSYVFRFMSAWYIVAFNVERYIGITMPLKIKRAHLRRAFAKRSVAVVGVAAVVSSLYKPFIVTAQTIRNVTSCTWSPGYKVQSFVLDSIYGSLITVVPFVIMLGLNVAIYRKLRHRPRFGTGSCCSYRPEIFTKERSIRLEFTAILLFVSAVFILLNVPFLIAWCRNFALELVDLYPRSADFAVSEKGRAWLRMAKTIFYTNYAVHFFIYCFYGAYFRCQLLRHVTCCLGVWQDRSQKYVLRQLNSQTSFNTINA